MGFQPFLLAASLLSVPTALAWQPSPHLPHFTATASRPQLSHRAYLPKQLLRTSITALVDGDDSGRLPGPRDGDDDMSRRSVSKRRRGRRTKKLEDADVEASAPAAASNAAAEPPASAPGFPSAPLMPPTSSPMMDDSGLLADTTSGSGTSEGATRLPSPRDYRSKQSKTTQNESPDEAIKRLADTFKKDKGRMQEMLELDPQIDAAVTYLDEYDWDSRILGRGLPNQAGVYVQPYLQSGHTLLLLILLLCATVDYPGFPLTSLPFTIREWLQRGIQITYLINTGVAVRAALVAASKGEPVAFWAGKCFLFGGLSLYELKTAVPGKEA